MPDLASLDAGSLVASSEAVPGSVRLLVYRLLAVSPIAARLPKLGKSHAVFQARP